ncbi:hypothetical protein MAR_034806 [Mya arenaria]|uniref:Uncharacterized protein n=1 Tax=Mya arenaria TaxID=6604 RepID=A0ABY7EKM0_MYAAR|nr:hypothetical protein MAR_034806 [Mya arenaria]
MRPHQTLRNILVHPKDKQETTEKAEVIYKIPCKNCDKVYVGESGRKFEIRLNEHKKDCETNSNKAFTRSTRKQSESTIEKSAITDHQNINNHEIDWEGARVIERESDWRVRKTKEALCIKTEGAVMNRDEGAFLSGIYNPLFAGLRKFGEKSRVSELRVSDSQASCSDDVHSARDKVRIEQAKSVFPNQTLCMIERFWRELWDGCTKTYYELFRYMEQEGILNVDNEVHLLALHIVYLNRIQTSVDRFVHAVSRRPLRTERNMTPMQL